MECHRNSNDTIVDYSVGDANELIFTSLNMADVAAAREGNDNFAKSEAA